jgi:hypothetical protein
MSPYPPTVETILDEELELRNFDGEPLTVREYMLNLALRVWDEEENFSPKRPFGNSGWQDEDILEPIATRYQMDRNEVFYLIQKALRQESGLEAKPVITYELPEGYPPEMMD